MVSKGLERGPKHRSRYEWVKAELEGPVYGLASIFRKARELRLPLPTTWQELDAHLQIHLYVEGEVRYNGETLRALTDDDELDLAYYIFESSYAKKHPEQIRYLLTDAVRITSTVTKKSKKTFLPSVAAERILPCSDKEGALYVCFFIYYDGCSITDQQRPFRITGLRLSGLLDYLRTANPCTDPNLISEEMFNLKRWPRELRLMRALITDSDTKLEELFRRADPWFVDEFPDPVGPQGHCREVARQAIFEMKTRRGEPEKALLLHDEEHFFHFVSNQGNFWNFQFFLFDDIWAGANPDLANSILKYCYTWDPFSDVL